MNNNKHKLQRVSRGVAPPLPAMLLALLVCAGVALAQLPVPVTSQFDITGFLQEATLSPACVTDPHCGGTLKVNGHLVTVPNETIVILPANALYWQELFAQAPAPYGLATVPPTTGLAMVDCPSANGKTYPMGTYEVHVVGNRVIGTGVDRYIAGLIYISQQSLDSGQGFISFIDYTLGEMRVGGVLNDPSCAQGGTAVTNPLCSGARVRLNDPQGRYGRAMGPTSATPSPDPRFGVDPDNPTITAATGFPMCLPRTNPAVADDPLCPQANRPVDLTGNPLTTIQMSSPLVTPVSFPNPNMQAPFKVGDYVTFAGNLVHDGLTPTAELSPFVTGLTYVSAHTITNNVAIYTWPGTNPAYVRTDVALIGTGGLSVLGGAEAAIRTRFEGFTTDPSRVIHLYGMDLDPLTGAVTDRDWGMIGVDPGPPTGVMKGRWRFRPPCTATTPTDKACTPPPAGTFLPPTREVRARLQDPITLALAPPLVAANGLVTGQYHAPILEYIFPENVIGTPVVPNNFESIDFLFKGGYTSTTLGSTPAKQLNPWPTGVVFVPPPPPPPGGDLVTITLAEYRTSKQRLILNATDSVISPNVVLTLQPYVTTSGTTFDPAALGNTFTNNGGGLYTLDIVGAPPPACGNPAGYQTPCPATPLQVKSNLGGASPFTALSRIRQ